ncbi:hypothetical protein V1512DRAFT_285553 [Lipomyces arxii]|uniref:uncharacterized protein n=1 Tax=Lipomyces arxii TaxID=56418 RepID=UPI0034D01738
MSSNKKIAVLGAGAAGLSCARSLLEHGFDVTIFEARDRIGGRIHQSTALGKPVDMGPNWMHGDTEANSALKYYKNPNVILHDIGELSIIFAPDGALYPPDAADKIEEFMWDYVERGIKYSKEHYKTLNKDVSLYDYVCDLADELHVHDPETQNQIKMAIEIFGFYIGNDVRRQSLKFAFLEEPAPGENLYVASGFGSILDSMADGVLDKITLNLKSVVSSVETLPDQKSVRLRLKSGQEHMFDGVVSAVPLGVLKARSITFKPRLPDRLLAGIDALGYGHLEKVYIKFPTRFWDMDYFEFFSPSYATDTNPQKFPLSVISLGHLPSPHDQPTLLWYMYGEMSDKVLSMKTDGDRIKFFEPYFSRIPGYVAERDVPVEIVYTSWSHDQYAGYGSYSNFLVGLEDGDNDIRQLRRGMSDRRVWFAGEHCSDVLQLATVGGAVESGQNAGFLVAKCFKQNQI